MPARSVVKVNEICNSGEEISLIGAPDFRSSMIETMSAISVSMGNFGV